MQKLYGDSLRKEAGFVKVLKSVASKNARILESRAGRHAPALRRVAKEVAKEVKGTFDKVYEETADVVEEFFAKCKLTALSGVHLADAATILQHDRRFPR
jgi:phosphatidylethanolamine N-methyltransferase